MPTYAIFYAWWQTWPADSAIFAWLTDHQLIQSGRKVTLLVALVAWSWPIAAIAVAIIGGPSRRSRDLCAIDGVTWWHRLQMAARCDGVALLVGMTVIMIVVLRETTSFDLAGVYSLGNELRAREALGIPFGGGGWVAAGISVVAAIWVWHLMRPRQEVLSPRPAPPSVMTMRLGMAIYLATVVGSLWFLLTGPAGASDGPGFTALYGMSLLTSLRDAIISGLGAVVIMIMAAACFVRSSTRWIGHFWGLSLLVVMIVPAAVVVAWLGAGWRSPLPIWLGGGGGIESSSMIMFIAGLVRNGAIAVVMARVVIDAEPPAIAALRRLDGAEGVMAVLATNRRRVIAAAVGTCLLVSVLSLSDVAVMAPLAPPTVHGHLSSTLLNAMHYQRPEIVVIALRWMVVIGVVASLVTVAAVRRVTLPRGMVGVVVAACIVMIGGCDQSSTPPLTPTTVIGQRGLGTGQFHVPRVLAVDHQRSRLYVIDKMARVQRLNLDGVPEAAWSMPDSISGKPVGATVHGDGRLFVADTHNHRILVFSPDGELLETIGSFGRGPGEFLYPTAIAFAPDGSMWVAEYGGNDRIQVFDSDHTPVASYGSLGSGQDQWSRPQSLAFDATGTRLYVADTCNHRIKVVTLSGEVAAVLGGPGRGEGELLYPYGVAVDRDGTLLVAEHGNARVQRLSPEGRSLAIWGHDGTLPGTLRTPWAVAVVDDRLFVLDTGNDRIQVLDSAAIR
jgi:DNA-binding beta-propeller fold protein YncE